MGRFESPCRVPAEETIVQLSMGVTALSLQIPTNKPAEALRRILASLSRVSKPAGVIGFASGTLGSYLGALAEGVRQQSPELPALFAASDGVFNEHGELTDQDGLVCLVLGGKKLGVTIAALSEASPMTTAQAAPQIEPLTGARRVRAPRLLLLSSQCGAPNTSPRDDDPESGNLGWFGAVTSSELPIWGVDSDGNLKSGAAGIVEFSALERPLIVAAPCCRLITEPLLISRAEGNTVFELGGMPALVALGQASSKLVDRSWIVVAIAEGGSADACLHDGAPNVLFRPVRGVDPARGAIVLSDPVRADTRLAFAVRDDRASRRSLEEALRGTKPRLFGCAPRFGLYFDGLGRGRALYGAGNVDLGLIRQTFGEFPILGMRSAYELRGDIGPLGVQTLTGQLAMFRNPS